MNKPSIHLIVQRWPDGHDSDIKVDGDRVTPAVLAATEDLLHTLRTGERAVPKDLYEICARAFGTSREDAKKRLTTEMYGGKQNPLTEPMLIGWTWKAHLDGLYADIRAGRWLKAARTLTLMLDYALGHVDGDHTATQELIHEFGKSLSSDQLGRLVNDLDISQKVLFLEIVKKGKGTAP